MSQSTQNNTNLTSKTVMPDDANAPDINSKTIMPDSINSKTVMPDNINAVNINSKTVLPDTQTGFGQSIYSNVYSLNGKDYKFKRVISANTGQAEILLIEYNTKEYVLKLYFQGLKAEVEILKLMKNINSSGVLVEIFDYGTWNDNVSLYKREFVVMEYMGGGSMDNYKLNKDAVKFRDLALLMTASITTCHSLGFIHLDIKPANFLFKDNTYKNIALCDFGTSAIFHNKEKKSCSTRQARTPIYASPDLYYSIGGVAEIDYKSDFYSLGISLICIWEGGEGWFKDNEIDLMRKKRVGSIPLPHDMPTNIKALINGLLLVDPANRWDEKQIMAWARGETIEIQESSAKTVDIIFNAVKNLKFTNLPELVKCMISDEALAKKYLYSGKVTRWLEDMQVPELAIEIEDICERRCPTDQNAGLWTAIYTLDAEMPYIDIDGKKLTTAEEIARTLLVNDLHYAEELKNPNHKLFLYFTACGNDQMRKEMNFNFEYFDSHEALMCMVYSLNPNETFNIYSQDKNSKTKNALVAECKTITELYPAIRENNISQKSKYEILSVGFLGWIKTRIESNTYEAIKEIIYTANSVNNKKLATWVKQKINNIYIDTAKADSYGVQNLIYYTLYLLDPTVTFDLYTQQESEDKPRIFSIAEVAQYYNNLLISLYKNGELSFGDLGGNTDISQNAQIMELLYTESRPILYFRSKEWNNWIQWLGECMNITSDENIKKCGPYDYIIALCKFIRASGTEPKYYLTKAKAYITSIADLNKYSKDDIRYEMENGYLKSWLAAFYQEDPKANLKPKYTYEKLTEQYLLLIRNYEKSSIAVKRYDESKTKAGAILNKYIAVSDGSLCSSGVKYILSAVFVFPIIILTILVLINNFNPPLLKHFPFVALLTIWIIYIIAYVIFNGFTFKNIFRLKALLLISAIFILFFVTLSILPKYFWWILGTALIASTVYALYIIFSKNKNNNSKNIDTFEVGTIEPLYYAFKDHSSNIRCSIEKFITPMIEASTQKLKYVIIKLIFMLLLILACGNFYFSYHTAAKTDLSIQGQNHRYLYTFPQKWFTAINGTDVIFNIGDILGNGNFDGTLIQMKADAIVNKFIMSGNINMNTNKFEFKVNEKAGKLGGLYAGNINRQNNTLEGFFVSLNKKSKGAPFILFSSISTNTPKEAAPVENTKNN